MAISRNAQITLFITSSSASGAARALKAMDKNNTGMDDVAGNLLLVTSDVLLALAMDSITDLRSALITNIETSQKLLDELELEEKKEEGITKK